MPMDYIEINFVISPLHPYDDILTAELANIGFESFVATADGLQAYIQKDAFDLQQLDTLLDHYKKEDCKIGYQQILIPSQNWNATWESNFEPIDVDGICSVRAPFHPKQEGIKFDIIIEPKMSFGTGHHETTFMMLHQMLQLPIAGKSILDMGCGTSVLAILAAKLHAKSVLAIDNDVWSYENSIENCALNTYPEIEVKLGDAALLHDKKFDIILANINRNILLNDMSIYAAALQLDGKLLMSGFFAVDAPLIMECASKLGLKFIQQQTKNNWALLHFQN